MISIFDGNNVLLRDITKLPMERQKPMSLRMRYEAAATATPGTHIWVWDGRNHNDRRKAIYPAYKGQRQPMAEDMFAQIQLFKEMLGHSNATQITCDGWEADDVIASLVSRFVSRRLKVTVHTNDLDYWQLMVFGNCAINGIKPTGIPCEPQHIPLYKACRGDPSDNIGGIPGFGPKTWEALAGQYGKLEQAVAGERSFDEFALPPRVRTWLAVPGNIDLVRAMLRITRFIPVSDQDIDVGITPGVLNTAAAEALLKRFFL